MEEIKEKIDNNQDSEEILKSLKDGSYFHESLSWYIFKYVSPLYQRSILFFCAILCAVLLYILYSLVNSLYPLVEKVPIIIKARDSSIYQPKVEALKQGKKYNNEINNIDEAILKRIIENYVVVREDYDFRKANVEDYINKINYIKNNSILPEYRKFSYYMSKNNKDSPINKFGENEYAVVKVNSFKYIREESADILSKVKNFIYSSTPTEAELNITKKRVFYDDKFNRLEEINNYIVRVKYSFSGLISSKLKEKEKLKLDFKINEYKLFKIKNS